MARKHRDQPTIERSALSFLRLCLIITCALKLSAASRSYVHIPIQWGWFEVWLAASTAFAYHFNDNALATRLLAWALGGLAGIAFFCLPASQQLMALGIGALWVAYLFIFREFVFVKPLLISLVWVLTTLFMVIPAVHYATVIPLALSQFCFILALSLGYDLVDMHYDAGLKTPTLALRWGKKRGFVSALFFLLLATTALAFSSYAYREKVAQMVIFLLTAGLLFWIKNKSKELSWRQVIWYKLGIDALLLL
jgi:4-hydroxybenzoate polyprenyltransferase